MVSEIFISTASFQLNTNSTLNFVCFCLSNKFHPYPSGFLSLTNILPNLSYQAHTLTQKNTNRKSKTRFNGLLTEGCTSEQKQEGWEKTPCSFTVIICKTCITMDIGQSRNEDLIILTLMVGNEPCHLNFLKLLIHCFFKTFKSHVSLHTYGNIISGSKIFKRSSIKVTQDWC